MVQDFCLKEEEKWIKDRIQNFLSKPYFFKEDKLIIASEDREKLYKRLKDRIWMDRNGQARLWYHRVVVYHTEEEYIWMRVLL